jgi:taurine dioxygenase
MKRNGDAVMTAFATVHTETSHEDEVASRFNVQPVTPSIGAEVSNIRLGTGLDNDEIAALRCLLVRHKVLVFRDQDITAADHVAFARRFGALEVHPVFPHHADHPELVLLGGDSANPARENIYHSDVSWRELPSLGSILRCVECPASGGDTIWVNMALAYDHLPESVKSAIENLDAVHDMFPATGCAFRPASEIGWKP